MNLTPKLYATAGAGVFAFAVGRGRLSRRLVRAAIGAGIGFLAAHVIGEQRLPTWRLG